MHKICILLCTLNLFREGQRGLSKLKCNDCEFACTNTKIVFNYMLFHIVEKALTCDNCDYGTLNGKINKINFLKIATI